MKIALIIGPSGSGKTTIGQILEEEHGFTQLISHTSRSKRLGETEGVDYYYSTLEELEEIDLVESTQYAENTYGLSREEVETKLDKSPNTYFITDSNGARQIVERYPEISELFFLEVTIETMVERMRARGDSDHQITDRMNHAIDNKEFKAPSDLSVKVVDASQQPSLNASIIALFKK